MESLLEQHVVKQSPFALLFTGMVLLGSCINKNTLNATSIDVTPKENWCFNSTSFEEFLAPMPKGLAIATIVVTVIFPMLPILVNSYSKSWNSFKFNLIKCHVVGQGSVFGVSELLRHFVTLPEPLFLEKCNITLQDCFKKSNFNSLPLVSNHSNFNALCNLNDTSIENGSKLFDSLHHFPDKVCCFIGASLVTFLTTLYFWHRINKNGKSIYNAQTLKQCILIVLQVVCVSLVFIYMYFLYTTFESVQIYGIFIGGLIQLMIYCSTLPTTEGPVLPPNNDNVIVASSILK